MKSKKFFYFGYLLIWFYVSGHLILWKGLVVAVLIWLIMLCNAWKPGIGDTAIVYTFSLFISASLLGLCVRYYLIGSEFFNLNLIQIIAMLAVSFGLAYFASKVLKNNLWPKLRAFIIMRQVNVIARLVEQEKEDLASLRSVSFLSISADFSSDHLNPVRIELERVEQPFSKTEEQEAERKRYWQELEAEYEREKEGKE